MKNISKYKKKYGEKDPKTLAMIEKLNTINNKLKNMSPGHQETSGDIGRHPGDIQETQIFKKEKKTPPYNPPIKKEKREEDKEKERGLLRGEEKGNTNSKISNTEIEPKTSSPSSLFFKQKQTDMQKTDIGAYYQTPRNTKRFLSFLDMEIKQKWLNTAINYIHLTKEQIENSAKTDDICFNINLLHSFLLPTNTWYSNETNKIQTFMQGVIEDLFEILKKHTRQGKNQNKQDDLLMIWNEWKKNKNSCVYSIFYFVRECVKLEKWKSDNELHEKQCPTYEDYIEYVNANIQTIRYLQSKIAISKKIVEKIKQEKQKIPTDEQKIKENVDLIFG